MHRLSVILAIGLSIAACKQKGDEKKQPAPATGGSAKSFQAVEKLLPDTLAGLPRKLVSPTPEIPQVSAYYQDDGNTRSGHVVFTHLADPARTLKYYEGRFPERAPVAGRTAYARQWQPKTGAQTAEGCLVLADRIGVCVDIAPGTVADLPPLLAALPLAEIEKRAAGP